MTQIINDIVQSIIAGIIIERATEIFVDSKFFAPLHKKIKIWTYPIDRPPPNTYWQVCKVWFDSLISCGYCTSVWVGGIAACFFNVELLNLTENVYLNWFCRAIFLHGMSNLYHALYELIRRGRIRTYDIALKLTEDIGDNYGSFGESIGTPGPAVEHEDNRPGNS